MNLPANYSKKYKSRNWQKNLNLKKVFEMGNSIEIYKIANEIELAITFKNDSVWLSQKQMAELFDKDTDTIGLHLRNIFDESELQESSTTELFSVVCPNR